MSKPWTDQSMRITPPELEQRVESFIQEHKYEVSYSADEKEKGLEETNLYFFFIGMVYLLLHSDSKFLYEFSYLWRQT